MLIRIVDNGFERYSLECESHVLGRRYDNESEEIAIEFPGIEDESACNMIITNLKGETIDSINMKDKFYLIRNNVSQYKEVNIGFSFSRRDGYIKNTDVERFRFLEAQNPNAQVILSPTQSTAFDYFLSFGLMTLRIDGTFLREYNIYGQEIGAIDMSTTVEDSFVINSVNALRDEINSRTINNLQFDKSLNLTPGIIGTYSKVEIDNMHETFVDTLDTVANELEKEINQNKTNILGLEENKVNSRDLQDFVLRQGEEGTVIYDSNNGVLKTDLSKINSIKYNTTTGKQTLDLATVESLTKIVEGVNDIKGKLQLNINTEVSDRKAADKTLQDNINKEISDRKTAINEENASRVASVKNVSDSLIAEINARKAADQTLQNNIDNVNSNFASYVDKASEQSITGKKVFSNIKVKKNNVERETLLAPTSLTTTKRYLLGITEAGNSETGADSKVYTQNSGLYAETINATKSVSVGTNLSVGGDFTITGLTKLNNSTTITGDLTVTGDVNIEGNITSVHTEEVHSSNDYIILREGNPAGLSDGAYTGFEFVKYDGVNNGRLVVDNKGIARVGDEGDEQPLATREETPKTNGIVYWNNDNLHFATLINPGAGKVLLSTDGIPEWSDPANLDVKSATYDSAGNKIDETYFPLTGGTLSGNLKLKGMIHDTDGNALINARLGNIVQMGNPLKELEFDGSGARPKYNDKALALLSDINFTVDEELSETSENAVQNKVITTKLKEKIGFGEAIEVEGDENPFNYYYTKTQTENLVEGAKNLIINPNLLINGDFSINQRGKETYSGSNIYCADRWLLTTQTAYFDTKTKFFKTTTQYGSIRQFVEFPERYAGKTLTISCEISDFVSVGNDLYLAFIDDGGTKSVKITGSGKFSVTGVVASNVTNLRCMIYKTGEGGMECSCKIKYIKLEIGSIATPFVPRPYAEELALCQRYYRRYNSTSVSDKLIGLCLSNGSVGFLPLLLDIPLRTSPTLNYKGVSIYNGVAGGNIDLTSITVGLVATPIVNNFNLQINFTGESSKVYALRINKGEENYIELDAEIY